MEQYNEYFYAGLIGVGIGIALVLVLFQLFRQLFPYHHPIAQPAYQQYHPHPPTSDWKLVFVILLLGLGLFLAFAHIIRSGQAWPWQQDVTAMAPYLPLSTAVCQLLELASDLL